MDWTAPEIATGAAAWTGLLFAAFQEIRRRRELRAEVDPVIDVMLFEDVLAEEAFGKSVAALNLTVLNLRPTTLKVERLRLIDLPHVVLETPSATARAPETGEWRIDETLAPYGYKDTDPTRMPHRGSDSVFVALEGTPQSAFKAGATVEITVSWQAERERRRRLRLRVPYKAAGGSGDDDASTRKAS